MRMAFPVDWHYFKRTYWVRAVIQRFSLLSFFCLCVLSAPFAHAASCYSMEEFEADRGLRMHSDIEVIMLTCRYSSYSEDLKKLYVKFLNRNSKTIRQWEGIIARSYAGTGRSRNEVIDNFRTSLANQKAGEAARLGPKPFCQIWADFVPYAVSLTPQQIEEYIRKTDDKRPTKRPLCG